IADISDLDLSLFLVDRVDVTAKAFIAIGLPELRHRHNQRPACLTGLVRNLESTVVEEVFDLKLFEDRRDARVDFREDLEKPRRVVEAERVDVFVALTRGNLL